MFALQDQDYRRAGARGLTRNNGGLARRLRRAAVGAVCAAAVALPVAGAATAQAATSAPRTLTNTWTSITLQNGWADYGNGTAGPAVTNISGIVHLKGLTCFLRELESPHACFTPIGPHQVSHGMQPRARILLGAAGTDWPVPR